MASYNSKSSHKNAKMKGKFYSDTSSRKTSEKPKKDKAPLTLTKVVVRRLPASMTEEMFVESVSPLPDYDYFSFINADSSLGANAFSRAYISFKNVEDVYTFCDKFDGYVFVDQKGNEHPAMVEYAPFQKIPKRSGGKKKDVRSGTIDEDAEYLSFLESLTKPVTINLPPLEAVLEEIQAHDRELKANNGFIKVKTPLLEYIEQRKAEKLRSKEEKREERRRKEFERKKAREEERKKKKEIRDHHREMKKELQKEQQKEQQKDDNSVKVLRPERGKEDAVTEGRQEKPKAERDRERQKREEEKIKLRKEKEKRREREKEDRLRRLEEKAKQREGEKPRHREEAVEDLEEKGQSGRPEGSRSKRYSEGRRKEREKDKREEKDKERRGREEQEDVEAEIEEEAAVPEKAIETEKAVEMEEALPPVKEERNNEKSTTRKRKEKDPRVERRIRNKDRPAMALYRPGQSRLSSRMRHDRDDGADTSSSSPSPVMATGEQKKCTVFQKELGTDSSRSDTKEDDPKAKSSSDDSTEGRCIAQEDDTCKTNEKTVSIQEVVLTGEEKNDDIEECASEHKQIDNKGKSKDIDNDDSSLPSDAQNKGDTSLGNPSKDSNKNYPGVKTMTFRRSVSRE